VSSAAERLSGTEREQMRRAFAHVRTVAGTAGDDRVRAEARELAGHILAVCTGAPPGCAHPAALTAREVDVLALAAIGRRNAEIARGIGVTGETVKSYLHSAMAKLGAHTRHSAVGLARGLGYLP
jgi:DNA-binding CsgD family transcriptional regulator